MPLNALENSFEPVPNDRRVIYACANPWQCDSRLEWFRQLLRDNLDIDIDKPGCTPLRALDFCPAADNPLPLTGTALSLVGWIILAVIMTILLISICLMALISISYHQQHLFNSHLGPPFFSIDLDLPAAHNSRHFSNDGGGDGGCHGGDGCGGSNVFHGDNAQ
uniref:LRRCT domain-containing protein n=1 Tax=Ditylenchus dipsaci TaxID=166011 RepID=A0A915EFY4_9BILA